MTRAQNANELRALIRSGALTRDAYNNAILSIYLWERCEPVWYVEAIYDGDKFVSQRLCCAGQTEASQCSGK